MDEAEKVEVENETPAEENVHVDSDVQNPVADEAEKVNDSSSEDTGEVSEESEENEDSAEEEGE